MENLEKTIKGLEVSLLNSDIRKSVEDLDRLLADDFIEFGSSGLVYDKEYELKVLPTANKSTFNVLDFKIRKLSDNVVQTLFTTEKDIEGADKFKSLRSSIWVKNKKGWQMVFHQGTKIK